METFGVSAIVIVSPDDKDEQISLSNTEIPELTETEGPLLHVIESISQYTNRAPRDGKTNLLSS